MWYARRIDPAAFRQADILSIHGERPRCLVTGLWQWTEGHHILGRGYAHGAGLKSDNRKIFSSIFNCAPLHRDVHNGSRINRPSFRAFLLDVVHELVMNAVAAGAYELSDIDREFLKVYGPESASID